MDYRFLPEPDLPPLVVDSELVSQLRGSIPELPSQKVYVCVCLVCVCVCVCVCLSVIEKQL